MDIKSEWQQLDGNKTRKAIKTKGHTMAHVSRALGYGDGYVSTLIYEGRKVPPPTLAMLCSILEVREEDLIVIEEPVEEKNVATPTVDTECLKGLETKVSELTQQVNALEKVILSSNNVLATIQKVMQPDFLTSKEKAVLILEQMLGLPGTSARCNEREYINKCAELQIDKHSRDYAIAKLDCQVLMLGAGKNQKKVIVRNWHD